jgi:hypothetical protein
VEELEGWVLEAEALGQGWLNILFHHICDPDSDSDCPTLHMTPADLDAFLGWLKARELIGTHVKTIGEVIAANPQPLFRITGVRSRRNGTAKLRLYVGCPGVLRVADYSDPGGIRVKHRPKIRRSTLRVMRAGTVAVTLRASSSGKRILRRRGRLKALVKATFAPFPGTSTSETVKVKLKRS